MKIVWLVLLVFLSINPMKAPQNPIIENKTLKRKMQTLRELAFANIIGRYGYINGTIQKKIEAQELPVDLEWHMDNYVKKCLSEINTIMGVSHGLRTKNHPPAQGIHKAILEAHAHNRWDLIKIIIEFYYAPQHHPATNLLARAGYLDALKIIVERGADINSIDFLHRTSLMDAAHCGKTETVRYLLLQGALLDSRDVCKKDALTLAQEKKFLPIIDLLEKALLQKKLKN